jgi:DNA-binding Lrp family transcriptional regulator
MPRQGQTIDPADHAILRALCDNARLPVAELARVARISRANAHVRLERLTRTGVIQGYQVRVNPRAAGLGVAALVFINAYQDRWRDLRRKLRELPEVEFIGLAAADFDMVVLVRAADIDTLRDVVLERFVTMPTVRSTRTVLLLEDEARGPVVPDPSPVAAKRPPGGQRAARHRASASSPSRRSRT